VRRPSLGLLVVAAFAASCSSVPDGAVEARSLACPPGEEGCDEIRPVGPGGELEIEMGSFYFNITGGAPVTGSIDITAINVSADYHNVEFLGAADGSTFMGGADGKAVAGAQGNETWAASSCSLVSGP